MKAVFLKELKTYFRTPLGYVFIGMMLLIMGFYYVYYTIYYQYADYYHVLNACSSLILFVVPVLTMRIMSEEQKNKTDQILLTSPISAWDIVLGKFFAAEVVFLICMALSLLQPLTTKLVFNGEMSFAMTMGGYIAFLLLGTSFIAIGIFISSCTDNQLIAAVVTIAVFTILMLTEGVYSLVPTSRYVSLGVLLVILALVMALVYRAIHEAVVTALIGVLAAIGILVWFFINPAGFDGLIGTILKSLSIFQRYADMFSGVFTFDHIIFFLSLTIFFLFLTYQRVEKRRWS